jgi:general secretion pathway protein D
LKASVQLLTGCVALGLTLPTIHVQAAVPLAGSFATAAAAAGQFGFGRSEARKEADDLLRQARAALKAGDLSKAESLLTRVDKLGVEYDGFSDRFKDNPAKVRKDLAEAKAKAGGPAKPSSFFPAFAGKKDDKPKAVPASPFAPGDQEAALNQMTDDSKAKAKSLAEQGRAALARGDKTGAASFYQKAIGYKATFGPGEYSPQQLAADLTKAGVNVTGLKAAPSNPALPFKLSPETLANEAQENLPTLPPSSNPLARGPAPAVAEASENPAQGPSIYGEPAAGGAQRLPPAPAGDKNEAMRLMGQAQAALAKGDLQAASDLAEKAHQMNVPEAAFAQGEMRPWQLLLEIQKQLTRRDGVAQASGAAPASEPKYPVVQGLYNPQTDASRNVAASTGGPVAARAVSATTPGARYYEEGLRALERQDRETALAKFTEAWKYQDQFDPVTRQQLQDKLTFLRTAVVQTGPRGAKGSPIEQVQSQQEVLRQKLVREIAAEQKEAEKLAATDPNAALVNLKKVRERVAGTEVEPAAKKQLLTLVDRSIGELTAYVEQNKATIESREHNEAVKAEITRSRELSLETQNKLAGLVESFNKLFDEQRYPEAEVVAKQAMEIAPDNPLTINMVEKSALARQIAFNEANQRAKNAAVINAFDSIEEAGHPIDDREPWKIGDVKEWEALSIRRRKGMMEQQRLSPVEQEIHNALNKQVEVRFINRPLTEVLATLSKMSGINIHPDDSALHSEGITTDTPVTIDLEQPISLRSALNLILGPMRLSYVIRDEVLKITSEQTRDSDTYNKVYYVADLVVPIPNFVPSYNLGLPGAIREAMSGSPFGGFARSGSPLSVAANEQQNLGPQVTSPVADTVMAQQMLNMPGMSAGARPTQTMGAGPGGLGGGVIADFDTLIELITTTIEPDSWDEVGGPGTIAEFPTNLSLVISQTQEIHEKISDLLEQLRRLQDLQVTIEVRFITLSDRFFERIGVDFDFNIDDNTGLNNFIDLLVNPPSGPFDDNNHAITIGLGATGQPTPTLDLQFSQGGFASTRPQFGGFDPNTAGQFGFAILSDIEAFFVLEAAQGDDRTNVLQAPKVTLFNGQTAFVSDTSQRPFVISVIPVVGDFAAAQQPVIVVLNEGTSLSVQAVVSSDRRFVRLTMVPFFSRIGDVDTFTFTGTTTSDSGTSTKDPTDDTKTVNDNAVTTTSGTTVQLPTFAFTTVVTTVSVPDGGTVLLGGIKRLREGRNERGIPILAKVPYISRLFRNVGIGRDAQSLMMMVTPRIIIQEEEEEKLGINLNP